MYSSLGNLNVNEAQLQAVALANDLPKRIKYSQMLGRAPKMWVGKVDLVELQIFVSCVCL